MAKVKVKGTKRAATFTKVAGTKQIKVSKTTGKIYIAKNAKKGTYKIKIRVFVKESTNYKAATKTLVTTVKIV